MSDSIARRVDLSGLGLAEAGADIAVHCATRDTVANAVFSASAAR